MLEEMIAAKKRGSRNNSITPWERARTDARREKKARTDWVAEFAPIVGYENALRAWETRYE
jgi:hypothetical protein